MLPFFEVNIGAASFSFHTNTFLIITILIIFILGLTWAMRAQLHPGKTFFIGLITAAAALIGARLFHVLFERPDFFREHPGEIFTQFDGMTFYGGFLLGVLVLLLSLRIFVSKPELRRKVLELSTIFICFGYGLLRVGCFANGCCWGKLSGLPWAVIYTDPDSVMPALGMPVHPVQLYDAAGGFLLGGILLYLYLRKRTREAHIYLTGHLMGIFFILYPLLRFSTEFFRGDGFRGENILLGLSVSQLLSVILLFVGFIIISRRVSGENEARI